MGRKYTDNTYINNGKYVILKIKYKNSYINTYIDSDDYERVSALHWRTSHKKNKIYVCAGKSGNKENPLVYLHNYIYGYNPVPGFEIDHIDGNSCNNMKSNLRLVTRQQNIDNTKVRIDNKIGIRGVSNNKKSKLYKFDFIYHGQRYYFKEFQTVEEAVYARFITEKYFNLDTAEKNPLLYKYINKLDKEQKHEIEQYIHNKVS